MWINVKYAKGREVQKKKVLKHLGSYPFVLIKMLLHRVLGKNGKFEDKHLTDNHLGWKETKRLEKERICIAMWYKAQQCPWKPSSSLHYDDAGKLLWGFEISQIPPAIVLKPDNIVNQMIVVFSLYISNK